MAARIKNLRSTKELEDALAESADRPVLLFKHSLTCPTSSRAFKELETYLENGDRGVSCHLITVQTARQVSGEAAAALSVKHESPQAILVRDGLGIWTASHFEITAAALDEAIRGSFRK